MFPTKTMEAVQTLKKNLVILAKHWIFKSSTQIFVVAHKRRKLSRSNFNNISRMLAFHNVKHQSFIQTLIAPKQY